MAYRKNERGLYVDDDKANYAINFIQCLKHTKGEWYGLPFDLIDWQEEFIRDVFGTINTKTGYRQYNTRRKYMVVLPIKNRHQLFLMLRLQW